MDNQNTQTKPLLLSDAPLSDEQEDFLWRQKDDIEFSIEQIVCSTILNSYDSVAFAVHGSWGAGKTSFLKIVEDRLRKASKNKDEILFCWYIASAYQGTSAPVSLMLHILRTLGKIDRGSGTNSFYTNLVSPDETSDSSDASTGNINAGSEFHKLPAETLHQWAIRLSNLPDPGGIIESMINDGIATAGQNKLVLFIDDLDRCSLQFIGDLLGAMQQLSIVKNLFILIAVDQTRLQNALDERFRDIVTERGSRWASEKYFQYRIELPELNDDGVDTFIRKAIGYRERKEYIPTSDLEADEKASEHIVCSVNFFKFAIRHKVPRTIKACLNLIRPHLTREINRKMLHEDKKDLSLDEARQVIKKRLIAYLFQNFYEDWLEKAISNPDSLEAGLVKEIEERLYEDSRDSDLKQASGSRLSGEQVALFDFHLERIKAAKLLQDKKIDLPVELINLLALEPFFVFKPHDDEQDWSFKDALITQEKLDDLYKKSEEAKEAGDAKASLEFAHEAYLTAKDNLDASFNRGWLIGNLALNAEVFQDYRLAERIHRLAIKLDPVTPNIRQNFAHFIVTKNRDYAYEEALKILAKLLDDSPEHMLERTLKLLIDLKPRLGRSIAPELSYISKIKAEATSINQMANFINLAVEIRRLRTATESFSSFVEQLQNRKADKKDIKELFVKAAHAFYTPNDSSYEYIAMDLYRQLLTLNPDDPENLYSNYPFLLNKKGYKEEAGCLWFQCYQRSPESISDSTMQGYVDYLREAGKSDLAEQAAQAQALEIQSPPIVMISNSLPKRFSDVVLPSLTDIFRVKEEPYTCYQAVKSLEQDEKQKSEEKQEENKRQEQQQREQ